MRINMVNRKFLMEGAVELYSSGANVIRPSDLYKLSNNSEIRKALKGCNLYIIARRKRISIDPGSIRFIGNAILGDFLVQDGLEFERYSFKCTDDKLIQGLVNIQVSDYPQTEVYLCYINNHIERFPIFNFMVKCDYNLDDNDDLEVLYVGQGYGQDGDRLALDRLKDHSTLQRILADTLHEKPDHEVQLLLFRYEHHRKFVSSDGDLDIEPTASEKENTSYVEDIMDARLTRKSRILLAEAGLIRYFEPMYNKIYKKTFPSQKHKVLEELLVYDFSGLAIQVNTQNIKTRLYSSKVSTRFDAFSVLHPYVHLAKIPLYSKEERESFLHAYL
ncbi:TPA: hypothetical protein ACX6QL_003476 [Photobacterium damselae]